MPTLSLMKTIMMSKTFWAKILLTLLLSGLLMSCSTIVSIKDTKLETEAPSISYKKLLVIGITSHPNLRKAFENIFTETLNDHGVAAVRSHDLVIDLHKADHIKIKELARQVGADGVVITRVLSKSEHTSYKLSTGHVEYRTVAETTTTANTSTTVAMSGVGIVAGEMDSEGATLQTRLFDATSANLVWTAMSHAAGSGNDQIDVCWKLSALLTKALSQDRLIVINNRKFKQPSL